MKPNPVAPFNSGAFSIKNFWLLCVICLSFFAGNLRADSDLSPADAVQAERLQKQIDAENKAAHDKAEKEWQKAHSSGGNATGLIVPAIMVCIVVGFAIYAKNKTAGKAFAGVSVVIIGGMVVFSIVDGYNWTHPEKSSAETANEVVSNYFVQVAQTAKAEPSQKQTAIAELQDELTQQKREAQKDINLMDDLKPKVTYHWRIYQANTNDFDAWNDYQTSLTWYQVNSDALKRKQASIKELESTLNELQSK